MADIVITPANVQPTQQGNLRGVAGVAISAGQMCRLDSADNKWKLASATAEDTADAPAMALNSAAPDQEVILGSDRNDVTLGSGVLAAGEVYVVSATAGGLAPIGDLVSGNFTSIVGYAISADAIRFSRVVTGIAKA